ncbi:MAG: energy transducer TonB, partial [Zoogloeaceae bacterium]|nr:energy transducer TonB [Zoogloeaceae bacterium]
LETPVPLAEIPTAEPVAVAAAAPDPAAAAPASSSASATSIGPASVVGDALVEARYDAAYLRNPKPPYPAMSRKLREEGTVVLRVHVLSTGNAEKVQIKRSSGSARLDEAARAAVHQWRFVPARRKSEAVDAWVLVPISFNLES